MKNKTFTLWIILGLLLFGCVSNPVPSAKIYTLSPDWTSNKTSLEREKNTDVILKLTPMRTTQIFSGTELIYTEAPYVQNSYAYSRWSDTPGELLQTLLQTKLEESGLFKVVISSTSIAKSDFLLESSLLDFSHHINNNGTSEGVIKIHFYLINHSTRTVIGSKNFTAKITAASQNAQGAVTALNKATIIIVHELIDWLSNADRR